MLVTANKVLDGFFFLNNFIPDDSPFLFTQVHHIFFKSALLPPSLRHRFFNQSDCIIYALIQSEIVPQTTFPYRR